MVVAWPWSLGNIKIFLTGENGRKSCSRNFKKEEEKRGPDCKWLPTQTRTALVRWTRVQQGPQVSQQRHSFNLYQILLISKPSILCVTHQMSRKKRIGLVLGQYKLVLLGIRWYSVSKGLACLYILEKWKFGRVTPMPHTLTHRQQNIVLLLSLSKV